MALALRRPVSLTRSLPTRPESDPHSSPVFQLDGGPGGACAIEDVFEILEEIGGGGFGTVYAARDRVSVSDKRIAIKKVAKSQDEPSLLQKFGGRILRRILTKELRHPNIIRYYAFYEDVSYSYIAMELCTGPDLFSHLEERGIQPRRQAAAIMVQVLAALAFVHMHGGVHRDVKLDNFMFADGTRTLLKLVDLGSATLLRDKRLHEETCGSVGYTAPEVFRKQCCAASDVFSAGVLMVLILRGQWPSFLCPEEWLEEEGNDAVRAYENAVTRVTQESVDDTISDMKSGPMPLDGGAEILLKSMLSPFPGGRATAQQARDDLWCANMGPQLPGNFTYKEIDALARRRRGVVGCAALVGTCCCPYE